MSPYLGSGGTVESLGDWFSRGRSERGQFHVVALLQVICGLVVSVQVRYLPRNSHHDGFVRT